MKKSCMFLLILLTTMSVFSQEARHALLIANGKYANFTSLSQPVPEAKDLKTVLEKLDFTVTLVENANREQMSTSLLDFETRIKKTGGIAFFHYGGHAVQVDGKNYLIPADAAIPDERRVRFNTLNVDEIMLAMQGETNIVILDSCRNNPLPAGTGRSATRGLTVSEVKPKNSVIVYSAQAGNEAKDGVFTPILTKNLSVPNVSFSDVLMKVRREVLAATNNAQSPGDYSELVSPVYLAGSGRVTSVASVTPLVTNVSPPAPQRSASTGSLEITSEIAGDLYLDGSQYGSIRAGGVQTIANLETGKWTVEVKGAKNTLKTEVAIPANGTGKAVLAMAAKPSLLVSPVMVFVEGGNFKRNKGTVTVDSFYMSKYEVTQKEWQAVMGNNPSNFKGDTLPVECVSWYEAIEYCNRLSVKEGLGVVYSGTGDTVLMNRNANGYRLPTEAEWEYAAKGGNKESLTSEYSGSNSIDRVAWYTSNSGSKTQPVGTKYPNALGIYDLSGNVWEWCWDWYGAYSTGSQTNPTGSTGGSYRVFRGGSWRSDASGCRVSGRNYDSPGGRYGGVGFRPVRSVR